MSNIGDKVFNAVPKEVLAGPAGVAASSGAAAGALGAAGAASAASTVATGIGSVASVVGVVSPVAGTFITTTATAGVYAGAALTSAAIAAAPNRLPIAAIWGLAKLFDD